MDIDTQRKLDRIVGVFLCRIFSLLYRVRREISVKETPRKILTILLSEMGSLVLARPMFEHIRKKHPESSVYVLLFEQNREVMELLDVVPSKNILSVSNTSLKKFLIDSIRVLFRLRRIKIDTVIDCELFSRISSIYSFLCGAKIRAGFHPYTQEGLFRGDFINRPVPYNPYTHISKQFITLVEALGSNQVPRAKHRVSGNILGVPPMNVSETEIREIQEGLTMDFPPIAGKRLVLIYPGGGLLPIRAWPLTYFCRLAKDLISSGYAVAVIGMDSDKQLANDILSYCKDSKCVDLTGYTESVRKLMIIFHFASLLVTNDGGPGHFAAMTPVPAIIFYGPETPSLYGPLSANSFNFYVSLSCSPCLTAYNHRRSPCDGDNLCLKEISPEEVLAKAYEILKEQEGTPGINGINDFK